MRRQHVLAAVYAAYALALVATWSARGLLAGLVVLAVGVAVYRAGLPRRRGA